MYYGIFSKDMITNLKLRGNKTILIRIFEPGSINFKKTQIDNILEYQDVLELYIPDFVVMPNNCELNDVFQKINDFIIKNDFDEIIVHCSMGISRSPAVMICVAKILNNNKMILDLMKKYNFYNKFIVDEFEKFSYVTKNSFFDECIHGYDIYFNNDGINRLDENNIEILEDENGIIIEGVNYKSNKKVRKIN